MRLLQQLDAEILVNEAVRGAPESLIGRWRSPLRPSGRSDHPRGRAFSAEIQATIVMISYGTAIEGEVGMHRQQNFLLFIALAAAVATPALGQTVASGGGATVGVTHSAAPLPDFTRSWMHPSFPWFEPPASGPGPVTNRSRWPQRPGGDSGSVAVPPFPPGVEGVSDYNQLVGDYTNPILQPWAAAVVKKFGEMSLAGITYGNPSTRKARSV